MVDKVEKEVAIFAEITGLLGENKSEVNKAVAGLSKSQRERLVSLLQTEKSKSMAGSTAQSGFSDAAHSGGQSMHMADHNDNEVVANRDEPSNPSDYTDRLGRIIKIIENL